MLSELLYDKALESFWEVSGTPNDLKIKVSRRSRNAFLWLPPSKSMKRIFLNLYSCFVNHLDMQSDCKNTGVFEDLHCDSITVFVCPVTAAQRIKSCPKPLRNTSQNHSKTLFQIGCTKKLVLTRFGTDFPSQMTSQRVSQTCPKLVPETTQNTFSLRRHAETLREAILDVLRSLWKRFWNASKAPGQALEPRRTQFADIKMISGIV